MMEGCVMMVAKTIEGLPLAAGTESMPVDEMVGKNLSARRCNLSTQTQLGWGFDNSSDAALGDTQQGSLSDQRDHAGADGRPGHRNVDSRC